MSHRRLFINIEPVDLEFEDLDENDEDFGY